jgi:hypothetical protein
MARQLDNPPILGIIIDILDRRRITRYKVEWFVPNSDNMYPKWNTSVYNIDETTNFINIYKSYRKENGI